MGRFVYIPSENIKGEMIKEMAHGAIIKYIKGGIEYEELMDREDYEILDEMFFEFGEAQ